MKRPNMRAWVILPLSGLTLPLAMGQARDTIRQPVPVVVEHRVARQSGDAASIESQRDVEDALRSCPLVRVVSEAESASMRTEPAAVGADDYPRLLLGVARFEKAEVLRIVAVRVSRMVKNADGEDLKEPTFSDDLAVPFVESWSATATRAAKDICEWTDRHYDRLKPLAGFRGVPNPKR